MSHPTLDALDRALAGRSRWAERAGALESLVLAIARETPTAEAALAIIKRLEAIPQGLVWPNRKINPTAWSYDGGASWTARRPEPAPCGCAPPDRWCVAHWPKDGERP